MSVMSDMSSTTAHQSLKELRKKGMITLVVDEEDNRIKYAAPTDLSEEYFDKLEKKCLQKASVE